VLDFGAIPNDGINDIEALRKAAEFCRNHKGTTLKIPEGVYDVIDKKALEIEYNAISGAHGNAGGVQDVVWNPDFPYVQVLDFSDAENVCIEARGATFLLQGWYEPISFVGSNNCLLRGLSFKYLRPANTTGEVVVKKENYFDVEIDTARYRFLKENVYGATQAYDIVKNRVNGHQDVKGMRLINPQTIRVSTGKAQINVGDHFMIRHSYHYRPVIMINESSDITIEDVKIHNHCGMGIVGHRSSGITMNNLQVIPEAGDFMATNTDATHFTDCRGEIVFIGCKFEGQGDDCTNVHSYYYDIYPQDQRSVAELKVAVQTHALALSFPDQGDTLSLVSRASLSFVKQYIVESVRVSEEEWKVEVTLNGEIPPNEADYFLFDETMRPAVKIINNTVRSHRARPFLIKTNNVLIKGNVIQSSTGSAIQIGAEGWWREGGPVNNIVIEDNYILDCAYDWGSAVSIGNSGISETSAQNNTNIVIQNNVVRGQSFAAFSVSDAKNITIKNNQIAGTKNAVHLKNTSEVELKNNGDLPVIKE